MKPKETLRTILIVVVSAAVLGIFSSPNASGDDAEFDEESETTETRFDTQPGPLKHRIYFGFDSHRLSREGKAALNEIAVWALEYQDKEILIVGHTDAIGPVAYNRWLGEKRAERAKTWLVRKGVDGDRIATRTDGEQEAVSEHHGDNRRIVLYTTSVREEPLPVAEVEPAPEREPVVEKVSMVPEQIAEPEPVVEPEPEKRRMGVSLGGGVVGFTDDDSQEFTDVGGSWEARFIYGTRDRVALEAAYVGSAHNIESLGLDDSAVLFGTSLEGDARVNIITRVVTPYVFGGLGWTRYEVVNEQFNTSNVHGSDNMGYVPMGVGVGYPYRDMLFDIRGTFRLAFEDDIVSETNQHSGLDTWNVAAKVGWEF